MFSNRKWIRILFPAVAVVLLAGLLLSRVFRPEHERTAEVTIHAEEAGTHIGKLAEVCGYVADVRQIDSIGGKPTFVNFGRSHPNQVFTVVIWQRNRVKWQHRPEDLYLNHEVCVTGLIEMHEGTPQIVAENPAQISVNIL